MFVSAADVTYLVSTLTGLQIRVKDQVLFHYTYAWSPVSEFARKTDWLDIRMKESTYPHIRCHWLDDNSEKELPNLMSTILESSNVTLLLVNTKNDHEIDAKFLDPNEKWRFPVAVVTRAVGQTLKYVLEKHGRNVQAKLEISNQIPEIKHEHQQEHQQGFPLAIREMQVFVHIW